MRRSGRIAWAVFALPVLLLLVIGIAADRTMNRYSDSEAWVAHTHQVGAAVQTLRSDMFESQDARKGYVITADPQFLLQQEQATAKLQNDLQTLSELVSDNPIQVKAADALAGIIHQKLTILQQSAAALGSRSPDSKAAKQLTTDNESLTAQASAILESMSAEEELLLKQRTAISSQDYQQERLFFAIALAAVVLFLFVNFGRLQVELKNRGRAEDAIHRLSGRILELQDAERRKVARELHDGIAQYLVGAKMTVDRIVQAPDIPENRRRELAQASQLLDQGVLEVRTLSHLLHPPLLDEVGFSAAAEWYVQGFSERSNISVKLEIDPDIPRMSKETELVLFRVLQESLTNIHRHSGSLSAEIRVSSSSHLVRLSIQDHGKGIPAALLQEFRNTSMGMGVGLAGIRERVSEAGGQLDIESEGRGTLLRVTLPLASAAERSTSPSEPPEDEATRSQLPGSTSKSGFDSPKSPDEIWRVGYVLVLRHVFTSILMSS
jgi:signal transduction histidine kinase